MKAYICDQCKATEEPQQNYDLPKPGWLTLTYKYVTKHFCGWICLQQHVHDQINPAPAPEPVVMAEPAHDSF